MAVYMMLDKFISLQRAISTTNANTGQKVKAWTQVALIRASESTGTTSKEKETDNQIIASQKITFSIRWRADINSTDRIVYDNQIYDILNFHRIGRKAYINIVCIERDSSPAA